MAKKLTKEQEESFARQVVESELWQDMSAQDAFWRGLMDRRDIALFMTPELRAKIEQKQRTGS